jgi:hypothetical protein
MLKTLKRRASLREYISQSQLTFTGIEPPHNKGFDLPNWILDLSYFR